MLTITVSDHCALILKTISIDSGPKPFKTLDDFFLKDVRFKELIQRKWNNYDVRGKVDGFEIKA